MITSSYILWAADLMRRDRMQAWVQQRLDAVARGGYD